MDPTAFISYAWESESHRIWVRDLAARLRHDGVDTRLDQWNLRPGDDLPGFMEKAITECDFVLLVCTPTYRDKAMKRQGGVGYEGSIITGELLALRPERKFVPVLRRGEWGESAPAWLLNRLYVDLRGEPYQEDAYQSLIAALYRDPIEVPPLGSRGKSSLQKNEMPSAEKQSHVEAQVGRSEPLPLIPSNEAALHEEARRLARLVVSELKLYNEAEVEEGRRRRDLYERLKEDIDRSRQIYEKRVAPRILESTNYFYQELVRILAAGDPKALGI